MTQHVRVRLDRKFGPGGGSIDHAREASGGEWGAALRREHEGRLRLLLTMQPPEGAQVVLEDRMRARRTLLDPVDVHVGRSEPSEAAPATD
jgi:hypothetical protein